jgi:hypothetical protein
MALFFSFLSIEHDLFPTFKRVLFTQTHEVTIVFNLGPKGYEIIVTPRVRVYVCLCLRRMGERHWHKKAKDLNENILRPLSGSQVPGPSTPIYDFDMGLGQAVAYVKMRGIVVFLIQQE